MDPVDTVATGVGGASTALNRMSLWPNDDILLDEHGRDCLKRDYPDAFPVFYWEELVDAFRSIDDSAKKARKRRQRISLAAVAVAGLGAVLSAALPLVELLGGEVATWGFGVSAGLSAVGLLWSIWLMVSDKSKSAWMKNRLHSERLRQLYFQFLLSHPDFAVRAMQDTQALGELTSARREALAFFESWKNRSPHIELATVIGDVNDRRVWFRDKWRTPPASPPDSPHLRMFLAILHRQRIHIQLNYVSEKLHPGFGSPESRLSVLQAVGNVCTVGTLIMAAAAAALLFAGWKIGDVPFRILTSGAALFGATGVFSKVIAEGLQLKADVVRYRWYRDALKDIDAQFEVTDSESRLNHLRALEQVAYREMREFLKTHNEASFRLG